MNSSPRESTQEIREQERTLKKEKYENISKLELILSKDYILGGINSPLLSKSNKETPTLIRKRNFLNYKKQLIKENFLT